MFSIQATGQHFNLHRHSLITMTVTILEKVKKYDHSYREERDNLRRGSKKGGAGKVDNI